MSEDDEPRQQASVNDLANFRHPFERAFTGLVVEMMSGNGISASACSTIRSSARPLLPHVYEKSRAKNEKAT